MTHEERVDAQQKKFDAELPRLLKQHDGRWVVYFDGVKHVADDRWDAFDWATSNLPPDAAFVIAEVTNRPPQYLTAAFAFGIRG